jgi:hypothetical protein
MGIHKGLVSKDLPYWAKAKGLAAVRSELVKGQRNFQTPVHQANFRFPSLINGWPFAITGIIEGPAFTMEALLVVFCLTNLTRPIWSTGRINTHVHLLLHFLFLFLFGVLSKKRTYILQTLDHFDDIGYYTRGKLRARRS